MNIQIHHRRANDFTVEIPSWQYEGNTQYCLELGSDGTGFDHYVSREQLRQIIDTALEAYGPLELPEPEDMVELTTRVLKLVLVPVDNFRG
jgi:hypothetical protein